MGHARCYVVFDAMRRILERRFGVAVRFALNITDVDDKIIAAANATGSNYADFAKYWEADFFAKMAALNVRLPDAVVRVSDFIPEIVEYIEQIEKNGFAYEADGSVYFDVEKFKKAGFDYCQLMPSAFQDESLRDPGEPTDGIGKRSTADFALWKKAKPSEPYWESKWGRGRPGWHIECSSLIYEIFGKGNKLDVHSGGSDLKFPHHDNEIAQGEAHSCEKGWVDYFIHCAPLSIKGLKMSKSLKNFITIDDALKQANGRQLRLYFLLHKHNTAMNFDPEASYIFAKERDKYIEEFLYNIQNDFKAQSLLPSARPQKHEMELDEWISRAQIEIRNCLANNFDTAGAMAVVFKSVKAYNQLKTEGVKLSSCVLNRLHALVDSLTDDLGLNYRQATSTANLPTVEKTIGPLVSFRRQIVEALRCKNLPSAFAACDKLRDEVLPQLGVKVEDGKEGYRLVEPTTAASSLEEQNGAKNSAASNTGTDGPGNQQTPTVKESLTKHEIGQQLFMNPRYAKFKIGAIDQEGMPATDIDGNYFPAKVMERFRKDLERELSTKSTKES